ncbi:hypothetical protein [Halorussus salinus]|uniref:hypothetical protein n=1 Tax=Halorussus salinus TaxID=1364935 RepID=UPI0010918C83
MRTTKVLEKCRQTEGETHESPALRAQVSIGALVLLIAALLIAATTAGVFFEMTDVLQSQTGQTSGDVNQQLTNRVSVVAVTGVVNSSSQPATVETIRIIVKKGSESDAVSLGNSTVRVTQPNETSMVTYADGPAPTKSTFGVEALRDSDRSVPVLTQSSDRFALVVDSGVLHSNTTVTVEIILPSGTQQSLRFTVPSSLNGEKRVSLD